MKQRYFKKPLRMSQLSYSMLKICEEATTIRYSIGWEKIRQDNKNNSKDKNVDRLLAK